MITAALALAVAGGLAVRSWGSSAQVAEEDAATLRKVAVRSGTLILSASGSGTSIAGDSVELGFGTEGTIEALLVEARDIVAKGDVLATQADRESFEASVAQARLTHSTVEAALQALKDEAPLNLAQALLALADARDGLSDAQVSRQSQQLGYRASSTTLKAAQARRDLAEEKVDLMKKLYDATPGSEDERKARAYLNCAAAVQPYRTALASVNGYKGRPTEIQQAEPGATLAIAEANVMLDELELERLKDGPRPMS